MKTVVYAEKFFFEDEVKDKGYLIIEDNKFKEYSKKIPPGEYNLIDYAGKFIAPGLVDTHIHGLMGCDVMDNKDDTISNISSALLTAGVTSFLPTTFTDSLESLNEVIKKIGNNYSRVTGAKVKGIFVEGPFFSKEYKGAQNDKYFIKPSIDIVTKWQELAKGLTLKVAIAPELDNNNFIRQAVRKNIKIALAHSKATYEEAVKSISKGASIFVHTFNGMTPLHHRNPGMVGAAMINKNTYKELICDGYHVHPQAAQLLMQTSGKDKIVLISDCIKASSMPEGKYQLGELEIIVKDNTARLLNNESLAGSVIKLIDAVKNVVNWNLASLHEAINMASINAARSVQIDDVCGKIAPGYKADFIVINKDIELQATYIDGKLKYKK